MTMNLVQSVEVECLRSVAPDLHNDILDNLHKLSFTSMAGEAGTEAGGTRHHFTKGGRLVASKQIIYTVSEQTGLKPVSKMIVRETRLNILTLNQVYSPPPPAILIKD